MEPRNIMALVWLLTSCYAAAANIKFINNFGYNLYSQLLNKNGQNNFICSTSTVTTTLSGLLVGAEGKTAKEINSTLGLTKSSVNQDEVIDSLSKMLSTLRQTKTGYKFSNSFFYPRQTVILPHFQSSANKLYIEMEKESPENLIFVHNQAQFDGVWKYQFDITKTKKEPFFTGNGRKARYVDMMYMKGYFNYAYVMDLNAELIEIPFAGDELSMVIILSKDMSGPKSFNWIPDESLMSQALQEMMPMGTHLRMPRFKITSLFPIKQELTNLGVTLAFNKTLSDFSGISGRQGLYVSEEVHNATIRISELGSAPAPDTDISDGLVPGGYDFPKHTFYTVDHPFMFLIRHKPSEVNLFVGQVTNP